MSWPSVRSGRGSADWVATASSKQAWSSIGPPMEKRASTFGVAAAISATSSALYGDVTKARAPQSSTM